MAGNLFSNPRPQYFSGEARAALGSLSFFDTDARTTPLDTYSDKALTVANPNPITLDSAGRAANGGTEIPIFLKQQGYYVVLKNAAGTEIWDAPDVSNITQISFTGPLEQPNVAGMTNIPKANLSDNQQCDVGGVTTIGDGGGGKWYWDSSSSATANVGTIVESDEGGTGRWIRIFSGAVNVKWFNAKGDATTDDAAAFVGAKTAAATHGAVFCPAGRYKFLSGVTNSRGITFIGPNKPANGFGSLDTQKTSFIHAFNGDFFTHDGADAVVQGGGGGYENIIFIQDFGSSGAAAGKAVVITGTTTDLRANWVRFNNVQWEQTDSTVADWEYCVDIDGSPIGGADGVRSIYFDGCRTVSGSGATGAIRAFNAFNIFISDTNCNGVNAFIDLTGPDASNRTGGVYISNTVASYRIDHVINVNIGGGRIGTVSTTANTVDCQIFPTSISTIPTTLPGDSVLAYMKDSIFYVQSNSAEVMRVGQDTDAGDTTETTELLVGCLGNDQGAGHIQFVNAAATGSPIVRYRFFPRNNADGGVLDAGYMEIKKTAAADTSSLKLVTTEGNLLIHEDGYVISSLPVTVPTFSNAARPAASDYPAGTMIWNTDDKFINVSDGTNWFDPTGTST